MALTYVYLLVNGDGSRRYVGRTADLKDRLARHNCGEVPHTSKYGPWRIEVAIAFADAEKAIAFADATSLG